MRAATEGGRSYRVEDRAFGEVDFDEVVETIIDNTEWIVDLEEVVAIGDI